MVNRKPQWLIKKIPEKQSMEKMEKMLSALSLNTVCQGANCPNIGECFKNKTATFMILGSICTRNCRFCAVSKGEPTKLDLQEPLNVAIAVKKLKLKHAVITSVTRDDIDDGGAEHFSKTIIEVRNHNPETSIEVLIPDFKGNETALLKVINTKPEIINHNLETVPSLYKQVRPQADYRQSLKLLETVKVKDATILTKTGIMVGLGEKDEEIVATLEDLAAIKCDIVTLGQYLQPSKQHLPVIEYITPDKFLYYKNIALSKGINFVESGPFVRSSYNAIKGFNALSKEKTL